MKNPVNYLRLIILIGLICLSPLSLFAFELLKIRLSDGETMTGKLQLPKGSGDIKQLVVYIHGTGPGTYNNRRVVGGIDFNYFDLFGEEFARRGIAFFSYNKRGVELGDSPPTFDSVDREKFRKVVPNVEAKDLAYAIRFLRSDKRLKQAKIILLGWSEGTIVASMVAEEKTNKVSALFLAGYVHENMFDVIRWQYSGASSMIILKRDFDKDQDGNITKGEYESEDPAAAAMRTKRLQNVKFEQLDVNNDKILNAKDFGQLAEPGYKLILQKIKENDEDWIWKNYFRVSTEWLNEHFKLEANKSRLLRLKLPIFILHGEDDANCDVNGVYDLKERFLKLKKKNLQTYVFKEHNHDLNSLNWAIGKKMPDGIKTIFEVAEASGR